MQIKNPLILCIVVSILFGFLISSPASDYIIGHVIDISCNNNSHCDLNGISCTDCKISHNDSTSNSTAQDTSDTYIVTEPPGDQYISIPDYQTKQAPQLGTEQPSFFSSTTMGILFLLLALIVLGGSNYSTWRWQKNKFYTTSALDDYITVLLEAGHTIPHIREQLIGVGWAPIDISKAIARAQLKQSLGKIPYHTPQKTNSVTPLTHPNHQSSIPKYSRPLTTRPSRPVAPQQFPSQFSHHIISKPYPHSVTPPTPNQLHPTAPKPPHHTFFAHHTPSQLPQPKPSSHQRPKNLKPPNH